MASSSNAAISFRSNSFQQSTHTYASNENEVSTEPSSGGLYDNKVLKFWTLHHYHVCLRHCLAFLT